MERKVADRRRWVVIDGAVEGRRAVVVASTTSETHLEMNRFLALLEQHSIEFAEYNRRLATISFLSSGFIAFIRTYDIRTKMRGAAFDIAMDTGFIGYWDRRDVITAGAKWI